MKPFSALTLALLALPLVAACTAQAPSNDSAGNSFSSASSSGPYLEIDDSTSSDDSVILNLRSSSSSSFSSKK